MQFCLDVMVYKIAYALRAHFGGRTKSLLIKRKNLKTVARHHVHGHLKNIRPVLKEFKVMNLGTSIVLDNTLTIGAASINVLRRSYLLTLNNR
ncbi:hypothetical protein ACS0TY_002045 [Phlomoides rotata]